MQALGVQTHTYLIAQVPNGGIGVRKHGIFYSVEHHGNPEGVSLEGCRMSRMHRHDTHLAEHSSPRIMPTEQAKAKQRENMLL